MTSSRRPRRRHVDPTDDWEQLRLLARWPEQAEYELIRPIVLFGGSGELRAKRTLPMRFALIGRARFEELADAADFEVAALYGDYGHGDYREESSPSAIWVLKRAS